MGKAGKGKWKGWGWGGRWMHELHAYRPTSIKNTKCMHTFIAQCFRGVGCKGCLTKLVERIAQFPLKVQDSPSSDGHV